MSLWHTLRRMGLVTRLYLLSTSLVVLATIALPWIAHSSEGPPPAMSETRVAGIYAANTVLDAPVGLQHQALQRVREQGLGLLTIYNKDGSVYATTEREPDRHHGPLAFFTLENGRYGVFASRTRPPPHKSSAWIVVVALGACAFGAVWLSRSLALPITRLSNAAIALGNGDLQARTHVVRNDELGDVARAFDDMASRVEMMVLAQKQLLANLAHELRTPLARMQVALDLAAEGDTVTARASLDEISEDLEELQQLVRDVLDHARLDDARGKPHALTVLRRERVDLVEWISRCRSRFQSRHPDRTLRTRSEVVALDIDPALLRRAMDNLLDNAAKYSEPQTDIDLEVRVDEQTVTLSVRDRGIGIERDDLALVGTPFFRTDQSRSRGTGGVGLGLSLARRIVEAHGGVLHIESEMGEGTCVVLQLPRTTTSRDVATVQY